MFTGLIQDIGTVRSVEKRGDWRIVIDTHLDLGAIALGASLACDGCCLTLVDKAEKWFAVDVSPETLDKTTIGEWEKGRRVNLEPSLKLGDELGGHLVSGHVDGRAVLQSLAPSGDSTAMIIKVPALLERFMAKKGSVTLDGIALTINEVEGDLINVNVIPHTQYHTTIQYKHEGDAMNIEVDMLARYVARMLDKSSGGTGHD